MIDILAKKYKDFYQAEVPEKPLSFCQKYRDSFELSDPQNNIPCAKFENSSHHTIRVIHFERFIDQFKNGTKANSGKRCDFILYDHSGSSIIFNELTVTKEEYLLSHPRYNAIVPGKQRQALEQLKQSVEKLRNVPEINRQLESITGKILLFSHRNPDYSEDIIGKGAKQFSMTVSNKELILLNESAVKDFKTFVQPYPIPFSFT